MYYNPISIGLFYLSHEQNHSSKTGKKWLIFKNYVGLIESSSAEDMKKELQNRMLINYHQTK